MTEKANLSQTKQTLSDLLANSMFGAGRVVVEENVDWRTLWLEAYMQGVSAVAFSGINISNCPEASRIAIKNKLKEVVTANATVNREHARLHGILKNAEIPYVFLKGSASAFYYNQPLLRTMGDVDFLVREEDVFRTEAALIENGYVPTEKTHGHHKVYEGKCRLELHTAPAGVPEGERGEEIRRLLSDIIDKSVCENTMFGEMCFPSTFHHGLVLLLHTAHHLTNDGIGLRQLSDWAAFLSAMNGEEFNLLFGQPLKATGLLRFAKILNNASIRYLGCPDNDNYCAELTDLTDELMLDIFEGGNLGQKIGDRSHEALLVSPDGEGKGIGYIFNYFNNIVYNNWHFSRKFKFILPVGWVYFSARYVFRSLKGDRPEIRPKKILGEARDRNDLYKKIRLFKSE